MLPHRWNAHQRGAVPESASPPKATCPFKSDSGLSPSMFGDDERRTWSRLKPLCKAANRCSTHSSSRIITVPVKNVPRDLPEDRRLERCSS